MRSAQFTRGRGSGRRCCEPETGDRRPATGDRRLTLQGNGARCRESDRDSVCLLTVSISINHQIYGRGQLRRVLAHVHRAHPLHSRHIQNGLAQTLGQETRILDQQHRQISITFPGRCRSRDLHGATPAYNLGGTEVRTLVRGSAIGGCLQICAGTVIEVRSVADQRQFSRSSFSNNAMPAVKPANLFNTATPVRSERRILR
jgi:hypothetical protein